MEPAFEPVWALAVAGSSYMMWEKSTEKVGYFMSQVKSVKQWVSEVEIPCLPCRGWQAVEQQRIKLLSAASRTAVGVILPKSQWLHITSVSIRINYFANPGFGRKKRTRLDKTWFSLFARVDLLAFCRFNQEIIWTSGPAVHQLHTKSLLVLSALLAKLKWSINPIRALCWTYLTPTAHETAVPQALFLSFICDQHTVCSIITPKLHRTASSQRRL